MLSYSKDSIPEESCRLSCHCYSNQRHQKNLCKTGILLGLYCFPIYWNGYKLLIQHGIKQNQTYFLKFLWNSQNRAFILEMYFLCWESFVVDPCTCFCGMERKEGALLIFFFTGYLRKFSLYKIICIKFHLKLNRILKLNSESDLSQFNLCKNK